MQGGFFSLFLILFFSPTRESEQKEEKSDLFMMQLYLENHSSMEYGSLSQIPKHNHTALFAR